jgi:predicted esterase
LALQWWYGQGEAPDGYLSPPEIYQALEGAVRSHKFESRRLVLHGFSRGSANIYAVEALDIKSGNKYFSSVVANAGGAAAGIPK